MYVLEWTNSPSDASMAISKPIDIVDDFAWPNRILKKSPFIWENVGAIDLQLRWTSNLTL